MVWALWANWWKPRQIKGHHRKTKEIKGNQRAIKDNRQQLKEIGGNRQRPEEIKGTHCLVRVGREALSDDNAWKPQSIC